MNKDLSKILTGCIKIVSFDCIYGSTIRVWVKFNNEITFKRVSDRFNRYPPVWNDEEGNLGDTIAIQDPEKEKQLEAIFKAFCLENKLDFEKMYSKQITYAKTNKNPGTAT